MFRKLFYALLSALVTVSCDFAEDISDCGILRLDLSFTHNEEQTDRLAEDVGDIRIYLFDRASGVLARIVEPSPQEIERGWVEVKNLPGGNYTITAWGGSSGDMLTGGFAEAVMPDPETGGYTETVAVGQTTLNELYMILETHEIHDTMLEGEVMPHSTERDNLFYASVANVEVDITINQSVEVAFIRDSHIVDVSVTGLQYLMAAQNRTRAAGDLPLEVYMVGVNGRYDTGNVTDPYAETVCYMPFVSSMEGNTQNDDIQTLRIDLARHSEDPIRLLVRDFTTREDIIAPIDVVGAITKVRDGAGNYLYDTQEEIDRQYVLPIRINILIDLSVEIYVNDWKIQDLDPIID